MLYSLTKLLPQFLYPLGLSLLLLAGALALTLLRRQRIAVGLLAAALALLVFFSTPLVSRALIRSLESCYPPSSETDSASAIVLLCGGEVAVTPPRVHPELNDFGDRVLHAARLYRKGLAPKIVITGGKPEWMKNPKYSQAATDAQILTELLGVDSGAIVLEEQARNTAEHGPLLRQLFDGQRLGNRVLLVTSAMHMRRSVKVLRNAGFEVIPAPTDYHADAAIRLRLQSLLPDAGAMEGSTAVLHEYYGLMAYWVMGWL